MNWIAPNVHGLLKNILFYFFDQFIIWKTIPKILFGVHMWIFLHIILNSVSNIDLTFTIKIAQLNDNLVFHKKLFVLKYIINVLFFLVECNDFLYSEYKQSMLTSFKEKKVILTWRKINSFYYYFKGVNLFEVWEWIMNTVMKTPVKNGNGNQFLQEMHMDIKILLCFDSL